MFLFDDIWMFLQEAHQYEMEETIRDMLTVTQVFKSGKYNEKEDPEVKYRYLLFQFIPW